MITPASLNRLERLRLVATRHRVGAMTGEHRSTRHGTSLDFADFREYNPGDDVRRIDVHHLARHDEVRLKLFDADDELQLRVLLDTSASMSLHGKFDTAVDVVTALAALVAGHGDTMTVWAFPATDGPARFRGRRGVAELVRWLDRIDLGGSTPLSETAHEVLARPGPPGMTIVVSDLLTPEWSAALARLPLRGADVAVVHIAADVEHDPRLRGDLALEDAEHGGLVSVSLGSKDLAAYRTRHRAWIDAITGRCRRFGVRYLPVLAGTDVESLVVREWRRRGVVA